MSQPFRSEPLSRIHDDARTLTERSRDHQKHLEAFAVAADRDLLAVKEELLQALELTSSPLDQLQSMLRVQLQRSAAAGPAQNPARLAGVGGVGPAGGMSVVPPTTTTTCHRRDRDDAQDPTKRATRHSHRASIQRGLKRLLVV